MNTHQISTFSKATSSVNSATCAQHSVSDTCRNTPHSRGVHLRQRSLYPCPADACCDHEFSPAGSKSSLIKWLITGAAFATSRSSGITSHLVSSIMQYRVSAKSLERLVSIAVQLLHCTEFGNENQTKMSCCHFLLFFCYIIVLS